MKLKTTTLALLLTVISLAAIAGEPAKNEPTVKLLPSRHANTLKLLYVNDQNVDVKIKLYNERGIVKKDVIPGRRYKKGFVKNYDLGNLAPGIYWVEISLKGMSVKYEIRTANNQPVWATHWKSFFPGADESIIASK